MSEAIDPVLFGEFIDESLDNLRSIPQLFIRLETEPGNLNIVNSIFRPVHTLKGSASFFGVMKIQKLAHVTETVMDHLRNDRLTPGKDVIDSVLASVEHIIEMMESLREGGPELIDDNIYTKIFSKVDNIAESSGEDIPQVLTQVSELLVKHVDSLDDVQQVDVKRCLEMLKPLCETPENSSQELDGPLKEHFDALQELLMPSCEDLDPEKVSQLKRHLDALVELNGNATAENCLKEMLETWEAVVPTLGYDPLVRDQIIDGSAKLLECIEPKDKKEDIKPSGEQGQNQKSPQANPDAPSSVKTVKTMRVSEESIDNFLSYVGDLIVSRYKFEHLRKEFTNNTDRDVILDQFGKLNDSFTELSEDIERSIMSIRLVPVRGLTQKIPKIIRDIAEEHGKKIQLEIIGEDIEVDKSLLDTLEGPMVHMVRNAADHGIERSEDRLAFSKPESGTVKVSFHDMEDNVQMKIVDDGKGLDFGKLKNKAASLGIIGENDELDQKAIIDLLFMSGVSTAEKVTDVSGRGVGMDVVRQNVSAAGGEIEVSSEMGKGSTFTVTLPKSVTTQIIEGFILDVCGETYVVPMKNIVETTRLIPEQIVALGERGECLRRDHGVLPLVRLAKLFETPNGNIQGGDYIVTLEEGDEEVGVIANRILGIQQVVVNPIEEKVVNTHFFSGAAMLGDGTVALVIDVESLIHKGLAEDSVDIQPILEEIA